MKPSKNPSSKPKVVVIGGGTGTFVVLSGLKNEPLDITAIISVADSGGSTGRLRDEFGFQPVGDLRQSLAALARENGQSWIKDLLLYRFENGKELKGHNLGNLILTALQDMAGSTPKALEIASKIFRLDGHIYPITLDNVHLVTTFADGTTVRKEHFLDDPKFGGKKITSIELQPSADIYLKADSAIRKADLIIIGPGDLYGSILPNIIVRGAPQALQDTPAKIVYVVNLMTRYTQTANMTAADHVATLSHYLGRKPDVVVINSGKIPTPILDSYAKEHEYPVVDNLNDGLKVIRGNFVSAKKNLLRHDQTKLTQAIIELI